MNFRQFHDLMRPARRHLYRQRSIETTVRSVNQAALAVSAVLAGVVVLNLLVGSALNVEVPRLWLAIVSALIFAGLFANNCRTYLKRITWQQTAAALDAVGSRHNQIAAAYEFLCTGKATPFAQIAVREGFEALRHAEVAKLSRADCRPNGLFLATAGMAAMVCLLSDYALQNDSGYVGIEANRNSTESAAELPEMPLSPASASLAKASIYQQGTGHNPAKHVDIVRSGFMPVTSQTASAGKSMSENSSFSRNPKPGTAVQKPDDTLRFAGFIRAGSSTAPPGQTEIKTDQLQALYQLNENQLEDVVNEKEGGQNMAGSSNRPFLDDHSPAPGRELGRSGKMGKPGDGRGGLGSVKKSRSTAAIFPGEKIPVHVQSQPNNGKSKSFSSNMPLGPLTDAETFSLTAGPDREAEICTYRVRDHLITITQHYFEEVYSYANRIDRESPQTD